MRIHTRVLVIAVLLISVTSETLLAQQNQTKSDSSFAVFMQQANNKLAQTKYAYSLQNKYASEYFKYYLKHPDSKVGIRAGWESFMFWDNTGNTSAIDEAMTQLNNDADLWGRIIQYFGDAYNKSDEKTQLDYFNLLKKLKKQLTNPSGRSAAMYYLGEYYLSQKNQQEAQNLFRSVVTLDANSFFVNISLGNLYELESLKIGQNAPEFRAKSVSGNEIDLKKLEGDNIILLEFWATWCVPCRYEIPYYKSLYKKYNKKHFKIIGIALNQNGNNVKEFIKKEKIYWPQIIQPKMWNGDISKSYNVSGIPRTYIIGRNGKIVAKDLRGENLAKKISNLLAE